jgi:hypothetical protein
LKHVLQRPVETTTQSRHSIIEQITIYISFF